jgi:DNA polymerase-1
MRADTLIVDGRHALWRTSDAFKNLAAEVGNEVMGTGGMYGFLCLMTRIHQKYGGVMVVAWEGVKNFRKDLYPSYKRKDSLPPETIALIEDMAEQEKRLKAILRAMGVEQYYGINCEADDVIGRLSHERSRNDDDLVVIYSGDSDLRQLVKHNVFVASPGYRGAKDTVYDIEKVYEKHKVGPDRIADLKALSGDTSDNIPGVKGIGAVTASKLIIKYGAVESVIDGAASDKKEWPVSERFRGLILEKTDAIKLYKDLTTIRRDMPMGVINIAKDREKVMNYLKLYHFSSLLTHSDMHLLMGMDRP